VPVLLPTELGRRYRGCRRRANFRTYSARASRRPLLLPRPLVLAALLVRRRGQGWRLRHRVSDAEGALAAGATAWTITGRGGGGPYAGFWRGRVIMARKCMNSYTAIRLRFGRSVPVPQSGASLFSWHRQVLRLKTQKRKVGGSTPPLATPLDPHMCRSGSFCAILASGARCPLMAPVGRCQPPLVARMSHGRSRGLPGRCPRAPGAGGDLLLIFERCRARAEPGRQRQVWGLDSGPEHVEEGHSFTTPKVMTVQQAPWDRQGHNLGHAYR
jgi:hypothetical protein